MTAWKSINTAPKDGTIVLLRHTCAPEWVYAGSWRRGQPGQTPSNEVAWRSQCCGRYSNPDQWTEVPT